MRRTRTATVAKETLPENDGRRSGDRQAWTDEHRLLITCHVDSLAYDAADGYGWVRSTGYRTLVSVLCCSRIRGDEIFADPEANRCTGLRWTDVSFADGTKAVLSRSKTDSIAH
ncbi:hypothetical protein [Natrinema salinisoli]|uniref:hypothetical protein n=1 Tax=Natrinema salinisoli TaxID=2878535 RepID=UPI001CEFB84D|nr:hypothetical protein [Natrinema salinisoli]